MQSQTGTVLTKVVLDIHSMGELDELPDGADVAPVCSAVQRSELPLIPHIHLSAQQHSLEAVAGSICPSLTHTTLRSKELVATGT